MGKYLLIMGAIFLWAGCENNQVSNDSVSISKHWEKDDTIAFQLPELDSTAAYHLFLHVRNTNEYPFSNLFLITTMKFPNGKEVIDTLEYQMALPDGTWMGTGIGNIKESKLWYKENIRFFEQGAYTLEIMHAMRNNASVQGVKKLEGISDVGYSIEKAEPQK